jgi:hypothetical protein
VEVILHLEALRMIDMLVDLCGGITPTIDLTAGQLDHTIVRTKTIEMPAGMPLDVCHHLATVLPDQAAHQDSRMELQRALDLERQFRGVV